jgi:hypothetical protein
MTIVRGKVVVDHGELVGTLQHGVHVERARSDYAVPASKRILIARALPHRHG